MKLLSGGINYLIITFLQDKSNNNYSKSTEMLERLKGIIFNSKALSVNSTNFKYFYYFFCEIKLY